MIVARLRKAYVAIAAVGSAKSKASGAPSSAKATWQFTAWNVLPGYYRPSLAPSIASIWTTIFPSAVASGGPKTSGRAVACSVSRFNVWFSEPPPITQIRSIFTPDACSMLRIVSAYAAAILRTMVDMISLCAVGTASP
jgi:hypothetical protein